MRYSFILSAMLSIHALAFPGTIYVPDDHAKIQEAIDAALGGDTIVVRPGTYVENIDFKGKAIHLQSEHGSAVTVVDGNKAGSVVTCESNEASDTILEGFTIRNGAYVYGGGMYNHESSPTINDCIFLMNSGGSIYGGGGMCNHDSSPMITDCIFSNNWSDSLAGGGMSNWNSSPTVIDCSFFGNWAKLEVHQSDGDRLHFLCKFGRQYRWRDVQLQK
jgi:hypothetical protein